MPAVMVAGLAGSRVCDGTDSLPDVRSPGRVDGASGPVVSVEGRRAAGAAPGGRGAARLWGANTPYGRLTCDDLSKPTFSSRTTSHYSRGPRASSKEHRRTVAGT